MKCSMANKALSEGVSCYKEMWGQERFYPVNRNEDRFAVVVTRSLNNFTLGVSSSINCVRSLGILKRPSSTSAPSAEKLARL